MRVSIDWVTAAGCLAMIATLALSLPGVRAVRADDAGDEGKLISVSLLDSGPRCEDPAPAASPKTVGVWLKRAPEGADEPPTIALNNRGYTYHPPAVDPEAREREHR